MTLTLAETLPLLGPAVAGVLEAQRPDGALVRADWGLDDPGGTTSLVAHCLFLAAMRRRFPDVAIPGPGDATLRDAVARAMDYLDAYQRPSGLTDLRDCNFDSSPDAGFILQALCPAVAAARGVGLWQGERERVEGFLRRMTRGALSIGGDFGGFHTPNHRWVIAAGLAQAGRLFPEIDVGPTIAAYLAEGFDLDADGAFLERSAGVYDAICDKSLLILFDDFGHAESLAAAVRNLELDIHLFHADATIETGLSRRQDYGTRSVPASLIAPYLWAGVRAGRPDFLAAARWLLERAQDPLGIVQVLLRTGDLALPDGAVPEDFARHFATLGVWRVRRGRLSATFFTGGTRLAHLIYGRAELTSVKISQSYFGVGRFVGDTLNVTGDRALLRSEGNAHPYRPGYEQPLGQPVPPEVYAATKARRHIRRLPCAVSELEIVEIPAGFDLRYRTIDGMDRVPAQIALDFPEGGVWETDDCSFVPRAGQTLFLKRGAGVMRFGRDAIRIDGGSDAHRMAAMRDAETAPGFVRVLVTLVTPVEHTLCIQGLCAPL